MLMLFFGVDADVVDVFLDVPDVDSGTADFTDALPDVDTLAVGTDVPEYDFLGFCPACIP